MSSLCRISIGICHLISFFGLFVNWLVIFYRKKKKRSPSLLSRQTIVSGLTRYNFICKRCQEYDIPSTSGNAYIITYFFFYKTNYRLSFHSFFFCSVYRHISFIVNKLQDVLSSDLYWLIDDNFCCCFLRHVLHRKWDNLNRTKKQEK